MKIYKNLKNNKLYTIYVNTCKKYGVLTAEPYNWSGKILNNFNIKDFVVVGDR